MNKDSLRMLREKIKNRNKKDWNTNILRVKYSYCIDKILKGMDEFEEGDRIFYILNNGTYKDSKRMKKVFQEIIENIPPKFFIDKIVQEFKK